MRVEVRALVFQDERVAVNEERRHGIPRLSLPGGRVERWETLEQALVREVNEELGVEVECGEFICAFQVLKRFHIQDLNVVFEAALKDPDAASNLRFVDPAETGSTIFPPILEQLGQRNRSGRAGLWLGNVWRDELRASV